MKKIFEIIEPAMIVCRTKVRKASPSEGNIICNVDNIESKS